MKDRIGKIDWLVAAATGVVVCVLVLAFGIPGMDPGLWEEAAAAQGLRPPTAVFPGLWRLFAGALMPVLGFAGAVLAGLASFLLAMCVRMTIVLLARPVNSHRAWSNLIAPGLSAAAAVFAATSDPVWRVSQAFTPELLLYVLTVFAVWLYLRWLVAGGTLRVYPLMLLCGAIAGETPLGFVLPVLMVLGYRLVWRTIVDGAYKPEHSLVSRSELPKWRMFFTFVLGLAVVVALNTLKFRSLGGLEAMGWGEGDILFYYGFGYLGRIVNASSGAGWVLIMGFGVLPLVVTLNLFPRLASDDRPMKFGPGVTLLAQGLVAYSQISPVHGLWFWEWLPGVVAVSSGYLLALVATFGAVTAALVAAAFAMDAIGRHLEWPDKLHAYLRLLAPGVAALAAVASLCGIGRGTCAAMQRLVDDAVAETVAEMGEATRIFTDGSCDAALELAAARQGKRIYALNMMAGSSAREKALRLRGLEDEVDTAAALQGTPVMLRVWAGEKPAGMETCALQLGFEFWRRAGKPLPKMSGMLARPSGLTDEEAERGISAAKAFAARILEISAMPGKSLASPALSKAFSDVSWRISRMSRQRGEGELADKLDENNSALKRMLRQIEYERLRTFMQFTPKEGLTLALRRADFVEARRFAVAVLKANEKDAEANFGMGMSYLMEKDYKNAETYLVKCLRERPEEPAVLNNLALICVKTSRYEEGLRLAKLAYKYLPTNEEVQKTLKTAQDAVAEHIRKNVEKDSANEVVK